MIIIVFKIAKIIALECDFYILLYYSGLSQLKKHSKPLEKPKENKDSEKTVSMEDEEEQEQEINLH